MKHLDRRGALLASAILLGAIAPVRAEGNRLLPFWAQPYPAGYVQREPGLPLNDPECRSVRRIHTHHGWRPVADSDCRPALHARD